MWGVKNKTIILYGGGVLLWPIMCTSDISSCRGGIVLRGVLLKEHSPYLRSVYASSKKTTKTSEQYGRRARHRFESAPFFYHLFKSRTYEPLVGLVLHETHLFHITIDIVIYVLRNILPNTDNVITLFRGGPTLFWAKHS